MTKFEYQLTEKIKKLKHLHTTKQDAYSNISGLTEGEVVMGNKLKNEASHLQSKIYELEELLEAYSNLQFRLKHLVTTNVMSDQGFLYDILSEQIDDEYTNLSPNSVQIRNEVEVYDDEFNAPENNPSEKEQYGESSDEVEEQSEAPYVEFQIETDSINDLWNDGDEDPAGGYGPSSHI
tara:strand:- start:71248 stop:71784 length:537 start_codon:yes stop_codon:yes gene_type:complete